MSATLQEGNARSIDDLFRQGSEASAATVAARQFIESMFLQLHAQKVDRQRAAENELTNKIFGALSIF